MRRPVPVPPEMVGLNIRYVQQRATNELSSSCPNCGGEVHESGEWPDRFKIFLKSERTGGLLGWCRNCGYKWTPKGITLSPEQQSAWLKERQTDEEERMRSVTRALMLLKDEKRWLEYASNVDDNVRLMYYKRGITDFFIEYWKLGYVPTKTVKTSLGNWTTPALSIPIFEEITKDVKNIRYRLLNPPTPGDKYRPEYGVPSSLFVTDYDKPIKGPTLIVEGEFKAMTTYITLDRIDLVTVGLPGKAPSQAIVNKFKDSDPIYLCLDPDADEEVSGISAAKRLAGLLGVNRVRKLSLPEKIDDMILNGYVGKKELDEIIKTARRC